MLIRRIPSLDSRKRIRKTSSVRSTDRRYPGGNRIIDIALGAPCVIRSGITWRQRIALAKSRYEVRVGDEVPCEGDEIDISALYVGVCRQKVEASIADQGTFEQIAKMIKGVFSQHFDRIPIRVESAAQM